MQRRILITGASGGIGQALCRAFAAAGDLVFGQYCTDAAAMAALQAQLGTRLTALHADFSVPQQVDALAAAVLPQGVDVLINNAGQAMVSLFQNVKQSDADRLFQVNVQSMLRLTRLLLPPMIARKSGRILNVSSMWGSIGASCEVDYSTSKAAVAGFTKALAKEVGPCAITVNCIAPGLIDTPMNAQLSEAERQAIVDATPLCRAGTPQDVAALAVFLAGEGASFLTGQVIGVDGGFI